MFATLPLWHNILCDCAAAVATLSLGVPVGEWSRSLEEAARSLIRQYNISVVVASGNSDVDSCYIAPGAPTAVIFW